MQSPHAASTPSLSKSTERCAQIDAAIAATGGARLIYDRQIHRPGI
jgi:hypothetical protein